MRDFVQSVILSAIQPIPPTALNFPTFSATTFASTSVPFGSIEPGEDSSMQSTEAAGTFDQMPSLTTLNYNNSIVEDDSPTIKKESWSEKKRPKEKDNSERRMSDKLGQETLSEVQQITQKIFEDPNSEKNWAGEAVKHSRVYFRLLSAVPDLTALRLTQLVKKSFALSSLSSLSSHLSRACALSHSFEFLAKKELMIWSTRASVRPFQHWMSRHWMRSSWNPTSKERYGDLYFIHSRERLTFTILEHCYDSTQRDTMKRKTFLLVPSPLSPYFLIEGTNSLSSYSIHSYKSTVLLHWDRAEPRGHQWFETSEKPPTNLKPRK